MYAQLLKSAVAVCATFVLTTLPAEAGTFTVSKNSPFTTIQSAVDAASSGDSIHVKSGVYVENVVVPYGKMGLRMIAKGKVILDARVEGSVGSGPCLTLNAQDMHVQGFTFRHGARVGPLPGAGIDANATGLTVVKCRFLRNEDGGIEGKGAYGMRVADCTFVNGRYFAAVAEGDDVVFERNVVAQGRGGFYVSGHNVVMTRNRFSNVDEECLSVDGNGARITQNRVDLAGGSNGGGSVISVEGHDAFVQRNTLVHIRGDGIHITGDSARIDRNSVSFGDSELIQVTGNLARITSNKLLSSEDDAINVNGDDALIDRNTASSTKDEGVYLVGDRPTITRNTIRDIYGNEGIYVSACTGGLIADNKIERTTYHGILLNTSTSGITIEGNTISDVGNGYKDGLHLQGDEHVVEGNTIVRAARDGIHIAGTAFSVAGNRVDKCGEDGIDIETGYEHVVEENVVTDCGAEGIELQADDSIVRNNKSKGNLSDYAADIAPITFAGNASGDGTHADPGLPVIDT